MPALNWTTVIPTDRTIGELTRMLRRHGVTTISTEYDHESGEATGLGFALRTPHGQRQFRMLVNVAGVHRLLADDPAVKRRGARFCTREHAEKVAWRVMRDWVEAQLALIDADMASLDEIMLPYLVVDAEGTTLYESYRARESVALEA